MDRILPQPDIPTRNGRTSIDLASAQQLADFPRHAIRTALCMLTCFVMVFCCGCSLVVMAGKAVMGDPKVSSPFTAATGRKLTDGEDAVVIICSAPHRLLSENPALQIDMVDRVSRILETHNIKVVPSGDVASWYDDHGEWGDYSDLANAFDARYVLHIDFRTFHHRVPESENLLQGTAAGHISVHEVSRSRGLSKTLTKKNEYVPVTMVFDRDFSMQFPSAYPVPREARSEDMFVQGFIDRVALHISQHMYDYKMSDSIH